jgi:hypothetical protein
MLAYQDVMLWVAYPTILLWGQNGVPSEFSALIKFAEAHRRIPCKVTLLGLLESVNMVPGANLTREAGDIEFSGRIASSITHPALTLRHAMATDDRQPALRPNTAEVSTTDLRRILEAWLAQTSMRNQNSVRPVLGPHSAC